MSGLARWLEEYEAILSPFFAGRHPGAREHVLGLLVLHAATCGESFATGSQFLLALVDMYRVYGNSPFGLPVDVWGKIRRAETIGMAQELDVDVCDRRHLPDPAEPISEPLLVDSLRSLLRVAPLVDSLQASAAISQWLGENPSPGIDAPLLDPSNLPGFQLSVDIGDHGRSAVTAFWALVDAYEEVSRLQREITKASSGLQLSFEDGPSVGIELPVDVPAHILSEHLRVIEQSSDAAYLARVRLYIACLEWYRLRKRHPKPMGWVSSAVTCRESAQFAVGA